mgnify:CR=1 FL=1
MPVYILGNNGARVFDSLNGDYLEMYIKVHVCNFNESAMYYKIMI